MTDYDKALKKVYALVTAAKIERAKKGYRENLGYDQQRKLEGYLSKLNLTYTQRSTVIQAFYTDCRTI